MALSSRTISRIRAASARLRIDAFAGSRAKYGDQIGYTWVVDDHVAEVRYLTFGCVAAIASVR